MDYLKATEAFPVSRQGTCGNRRDEFQAADKYVVHQIPDLERHGFFCHMKWDDFVHRLHKMFFLASPKMNDKRHWIAENSFHRMLGNEICEFVDVAKVLDFAHSENIAETKA